MINTKEYSQTVHRSLLQRELIFGIPQMGVLVLLLLGFFFLYALEMYFMIVPIIVIYIAMRILTKKDQYLIDIIIENINQKDILLP